MLASVAGVACLLLLIFIGVPIGFAMSIIGFAGVAFLVNFHAATSLLGEIVYETALNYNLAILPMFVLMGNIISHSRLAEDMYDASNALLGRLKGGLALATIAACAMFSTVSGSSLATAATMARVAVPAMRRYNYSDTLAAGSVAAGGTLGMLIPPSAVLVLYAIMTGNDIGKLFIAGVLPGILGVVLYMCAVRYTVWRNPKSGPAGDRMSWPDKWRAIRGASGVALLMAFTILGIYFGIFTPTEAGGIGAFTAFLLALSKRSLTPRLFLKVLVQTAETSATLLIVLLGGMLFGNFIEIAHLPQIMSEFLISLNVPPMILLVVILGIYFILGCFLEAISIILLTLPIVYPIIIHLGFDPTWFGIILVVVTEIAMITPPIGMNVFVLNSVLPDVALSTIFRGLVPFIVVDIIRLALLVAIPSIILILPSMM
jgi:C4-dicarboxylate transporter, DctM subunit